ncbi:putative harbinger transposase-derived nuclease [Abeliophyllum distichum]|uniref:Harbinger transposase-derived nuclease n=1 Tax=Abeliophyllum distichum TaxID=126358 RepID=A0ABD1T001_9LAMI
MDEEIDINSQLNSDSDDVSDSTLDNLDEESIAKLERDTLTWLMYCRAAGSLVRQYIQSSRKRIRRFPNERNGRVFMITALEEDPNITFCEFRIYPPMFVHFTHLLRDEYELQSGQDVDIYEQVGMFLFILAHGKGYRQVRTVFGHSLQIIHHYFGVVLRAVVKLGAKIIKPKSDYNDSPPDHRPSPTRHPYFQDCIGAIDGTHVKTVLPASERLQFIGRKGYPSQIVLAACDFNMCFMFVLPGTTGNVHDNRILARAIHSADINFSEPANGKYYLVDLGFVHRPGYMAPYKGPDIRYHFQEFPAEPNGRHRQFRNSQERFNFNHSSLRNIIELTFGVLKNMWNILDRMPHYCFRKQTAVVVATMAIQNFLRRAGIVDKAFQTVEEVVDASEIDFPDAADEIVATNFAPHVCSTEWDQFRNHIAQNLVPPSEYYLESIKAAKNVYIQFISDPEWSIGHHVGTHKVTHIRVMNNDLVTINAESIAYLVDSLISPGQLVAMEILRDLEEVYHPEMEYDMYFEVLIIHWKEYRLLWRWSTPRP